MSRYTASSLRSPAHIPPDKSRYAEWISPDSLCFLQPNELQQGECITDRCNEHSLIGPKELAPNSNNPLREGKGRLHEGGTRVPCMVAWPGVVKPGSRAVELISSADLLLPAWRSGTIDEFPARTNARVPRSNLAFREGRTR